MNQAPGRATAVLAAALTAGLAHAQTTERVNLGPGGVQASMNCDLGSISADGWFVVFESGATNLVLGDTNAKWDVFVRDLHAGITERVSVSSAGTQGGNHSSYPSMSADGRFVAFLSLATDLVSGDTNGYQDVFVHDRQTGSTVLASVDSAGVQANYHSEVRPAISGDGRFVAFSTAATNLVAGDTNGCIDVFVRDRDADADGIFDEAGAVATERVSVSSTGAEGNNPSGTYGGFYSISADGWFVAFNSGATNLVANDTNGRADVFVRDRQSGTTDRVSVDSLGAQSNGNSHWPTISADGRFVAFASDANNLVPGDTTAAWDDGFVHDSLTGATVRVNVSTAGVEANGDCWMTTCSMSLDGRFVVFSSGASNLVAGDTNGQVDTFVRDRDADANGIFDESGGVATDRANLTWTGAESLWGGASGSVSADGRRVVFGSFGSDYVVGDTNGWSDVFLRERWPAIPATDLCQAGSGGVIPCPCSNPPANAPRGCDNSAATGGAQLTSSGTASLAFDSLVFSTNGEKPTATSIVLQGNAAVANGIAFGQGVRCVGGGLKRLYVKTASGGSITAPGPGDASVSARSAALGSPISAGTNRWYAVYYRDPIVLGGCAATSTFNITQTQLVTWGS